jgi:hypothetical protein
MTTGFHSNNKPITVVIGIKTKKPVMMRIQAMDDRKPSTFYTNRKGMVKGYREFEIKMPQTPAYTVLNVFNTAVGNFPVGQDTSFEIVKCEPKALDTRPIPLSKRDLDFIKFAQEFSSNASALSAGDMKPHIYRSDDGKFHFDYYNKIRDRKTGRVMNTPARIGHNTGIIEISKSDFFKYTVPMRMIILLHEYSHKYKNPENGNPIGYESGADINGLNMYLSLGYPEIEAHQAFLFVFNGANSKGNHKRYLIIKDFIHKFHNGGLKQYVTFK